MEDSRVEKTTHTDFLKKNEILKNSWLKLDAILNSFAVDSIGCLGFTLMAGSKKSEHEVTVGINQILTKKISESWLKNTEKPLWKKTNWVLLKQSTILVMTGFVIVLQWSKMTKKYLQKSKVPQQPKCLVNFQTH